MDNFGGPGGDGGGNDADRARSARATRQVAGLRRTARRIAAGHAAQLEWVAQLSADCTTQARGQLADCPPGWGRPSEAELVDSLVTHELMVTLGIPAGEARRLETLATRLVRVLPDTLAALAAGRVDLPRAGFLAEATGMLDDASARAVQALVLPLAGDGPWDGPEPRRWRDQVNRAVVRVDADAARRRREAAVKARAVRAWAWGDGTGVLQVTAADHDIVLADRVITDLAHAWPQTGPEGTALSLDQRRSDALIDLLRRVGDGNDLPHLSRRRDREVGVVLHADTLFADGPAEGDPGELRGLGPPAPLDPGTAAELARAEIGRGAGTRVLLVDDGGVLQRTLRLPVAPPEGWTRPTLTAAARAALADPGRLPPMSTDAYAPTVAIAEHVRAAHPRCTSYDCARVSRRCDLDHDQPWPRGPTSVTNLCPRCRRHHELKTRGLVHTHLHRDGTLTTTTLRGLTVTTRPAPLPGHGPAEGYGR